MSDISPHLGEGQWRVLPSYKHYAPTALTFCTRPQHSNTPPCFLQAKIRLTCTAQSSSTHCSVSVRNSRVVQPDGPICANRTCLLH
jgi:hypothetical protein